MDEADDLPPTWATWREETSLVDYESRWRAIEAAGDNPHGEADLVEALGARRVLDGGCGTGRVAVELARRGLDVVGVDPDSDLLALAREKAPGLTWVETPMEELHLGRRFDLVLLAGNVVPYATDRPGLVTGCARHLVPGGSLLAGFRLQPGWPTPGEYDAWCAEAGLVPLARWRSWSRDPYDDGDYVVALHISAG